MLTDVLAGQEHVRRMLERGLGTGRLGHALLFSGPRGLGKAEAAVALARASCCSDPERGGALGGCGACVPCRQVAEGGHPDVRWVAPSPGSIRIEQVREVIREACLRPFSGRGRVFIFRDADRLTEEAANALLKVLEEPPEGTRFILLTAVPGAVLPTIRSRCQELAFRPLAPEAVAALLGERQGLAGEEALRLAALAGGNPGLALELARSPRLREALELAERTVRLAGAPLDPFQLFALAQEMEAFQAASRTEDGGVDLIDVLLWTFRDLLVDALSGGTGRGPASLLASIDCLRQARRQVDAGANRRLVFEVLLAKLQAAMNNSYNQ